MALRSAVFFNTSTGSFTGISGTADDVAANGIDSGAATDLLLKRATATKATIGATSVTFDSTITSLASGATSLTLFPTPTTLNIGAAAAAINIGVTGGLTSITGSVSISQNLTVVGTTFTTNAETILINDNHLYLNNAYATPVAQTGGLVVNRLPTATTDTVAAGGFATTSTIATTGAATFAAGDIIQVSGATNPANNGIFQVLTHAANVLTIDTTPDDDFLQNVFVVSVGAVGALTKINVSVLRSNTAGTFWEVGYGSVSPLSFSNLTTAAGSTMQAAYAASGSPATIATNATNDEFLVSGTAGLRVTGSGADNTVSAGFGFEVDTTGAFRLLGDTASTISTTAAALTLSTVTSGAFTISSAGIVDVDGTATTIDGTSISIDGTAASNFTVTGTGDNTFSSTLGSAVITSGEAAVDALRFNASNAAGGADIDAGTGGITIDTTGAFSIDGDTASNITVLTGNLTVGTQTSGNLLLQTVTAGDVLISTTTAGEVDLTAAGLMDFNAAASLDIDVTGSFDMLSTGVFSVDGTGPSNVSATSGNLTISTITAGDLIMTAIGLWDLNAGANLDADITGTVDFLATSTGSFDFTGASNFSTTSGNLSLESLTSGNVIVNSAADVDINATTGITADGTTISIDGTDTTNFSMSASAAGAKTFTIDAFNAGAGTGNLDINADDAITIDSSAANFSIDGVTSSNVTVTGAAQDLTLSSVGGSVITQGTEAAVDAVRINASAAAGGADIDAGTGGITVDTTGSFSIDGAAPSNVSTTAATLTISTITSGALAVTSAGSNTITSATTTTINTVGGDALFDNQFATGFTNIDTGTDTSATGVRIRNNSGTANFTVNGAGNTVIGATAANTVTVTADVSSNIIPDASGTRDIGASTDLWDEIFGMTGYFNTRVTATTGSEVQLGSTTVSPRVPNMTTAQRTALTATNGMIVYDTTASEFYVYRAGAWSVLSVGGSLQTAYVAGNTISVITAEGPILFSNVTDDTNVLGLSRDFAGAGVALNIAMAAATTGIGFNGVFAGSGDAVFLNNTGTGAAFTVQDGGADVLDVTSAGAFTVTPTSGTNFTATVAGAGVIDLNAGAGGITADATAGSIAFTTTTSGNITGVSAGTILFDSAGVLELNSSAAAISIGNDANAFAINMGTGAAARTITLGNSTGATQIDLNAGTAGVNVGTNAIAHEVTVGSTTTTSGITMNTGTGGIDIGTNAVAATIAIGNTASTQITINPGTIAFSSGVDHTGTVNATVAGTGKNLTWTAGAGDTIRGGNASVVGGAASGIGVPGGAWVGAGGAAVGAASPGGSVTLNAGVGTIAAATIQIGNTSSTISTINFGNAIDNNALNIIGTGAVAIGGNTVSCTGSTLFSAIPFANIDFGTSEATSTFTLSARMDSNLMPTVGATYNIGEVTTTTNRSWNRIAVGAIGEKWVAQAATTTGFVVQATTTTGECKDASANVIGNCKNVVGAVDVGVGIGLNVLILNLGLVTLDAEVGVIFAPGDLVYLSRTAPGEVTSVATVTAGEVNLIVGIAYEASAAGGTFRAKWAPRPPVVV